MSVAIVATDSKLLKGVEEYTKIADESQWKIRVFGDLESTRTWVNEVYPN
jgi:hypothetical protein